MKGRPPKPTALKILQGNPGHRRLNEHEPQLDVEAPECPEYLDEIAQAEWNRVIPILLRMRVLTEADQMNLGILCQSFSRMVFAQREMAKAGILYKSDKGYIQQSPLLGIIHREISIISKISGEFGLTSAARVRLHALPEEGPRNKWADIG